MKRRALLSIVVVLVTVCVSAQEWTHYHKSNTLQNTIIGDQVNCGLEDAQGNFWFGTDEGLSLYREAENEWINFHEAGDWNLEDVTSLAISQEQVLFAGTKQNGLFRFDGWAWERYGIENGLPSTQISGLAVDTEGILWLSCSAGLAKFDGQAFTSYSIPASFFNDLSTIHIDASNNIWAAIGHPDPRLLKFESGTETWSTYPLNDLCGQNVEAIDSDANGLWLATDEGLCRFSEDAFIVIDELSGTSGTDVKVNSQGVWYVADGPDGGFHLWDGNSWILQSSQTVEELDEPQMVLPISGSRCFVGDVNGLASLDGGIWSKRSTFDGDGLLGIESSTGVTDMLLNNKGEMIFSLESGGICRFDGHQWHSYTEEEGLSDLQVQALGKDGDDDYWILSEDGISFFDGNTFELSYASSAIREFDVKGDQVAASIAGTLLLKTGEEWLEYTLPSTSLGIILDLLIADSGDIWCAVGQKNYMIFSNGSWTDTGLSVPENVLLVENSTGDIVIRTTNGLQEFNNGNLTNLVTGSWNSNQIDHMTASSLGGFWMTSGSDVAYLNLDGVIEMETPLMEGEIFGIFEDAHAESWVAHSTGSSHLRQSNHQVWPGDCNADGSVDVRDVLQIALAFDGNGPLRMNGNSNWEGQDFAEWSDSFSNGLNHAYGDCDGNGQIDEMDIEVVSENYRNFYFKNDYPFEKVELSVSFDLPDGSSAGSPIEFHFAIGNSGVAFESFLGVALEFSNEAPFSWSNASLEANTTWAFDQNEYLSFSKETESSFDLALARSSKEGVVGQGHLFSLQSNLTESLTASELEQLIDQLKIESGHLMSESGRLFSVRLTDGNEVNTSLIQEPQKEKGLRLYPNPAQDHFFIESSIALVDSAWELEVFDQSSRLVKHLSPSDKAEHSFSIKLELPNGLYLVRISNEAGLSQMSRLSIVH